MRVYLYSSEMEGKGKDIQRMMEDLQLDNRLSVIRSVDILSQKLKEPWEQKPILVILASTKDELLDLVSIRERLYPVRLILILPDAEEGTISLAHRLRPNYLTYVHRNIEELRVVLERMMERNQ
jgi:hypothetical protein